MVSISSAGVAKLSKGPARTKKTPTLSRQARFGGLMIGTGTEWAWQRRSELTLGRLNAFAASADAHAARFVGDYVSCETVDHMDIGATFLVVSGHESDL
jgi:hypothetical protein